MFIFSLLLFLYVFYSIYDLHFYPCFFFLSEGCKKKEKENTVDVSRILRASFSCVLRERDREIERKAGKGEKERGQRNEREKESERKREE